MEPKTDATHSPTCTAVVAEREGRLHSPWSAAFRIEEESGPADGRRWYVVPCADPRCPAVRRMLFERPARARRAHAAA